MHCVGEWTPSDAGLPVPIHCHRRETDTQLATWCSLSYRPSSHLKSVAIGEEDLFLSSEGQRMDLHKGWGISSHFPLVLSLSQTHVRRLCGLESGLDETWQ